MAQPGFAEMISSRREKLKMSQAEAASKIRVSMDFLGLVERGRRKPALEKLPSWSAALGIPLGELAMSWIENSSPAVALELRGRRGERRTYEPGADEIELMAAAAKLDDNLRQAVMLIVTELAR